MMPEQFCSPESKQPKPFFVTGPTGLHLLVRVHSLVFMAIAKGQRSPLLLGAKPSAGVVTASRGTFSFPEEPQGTFCLIIPTNYRGGGERCPCVRSIRQ